MKKIYTLIAITIFFVSCDKYLEITPKGRVIPETTEDFRLLLNQGYNEFPDYKSPLFLRTDNVISKEKENEHNETLHIYSWGEVATTFNNSPYAFPYQKLYNVIFYTNEVINTGGSKMPNSQEKNQILAEAYALRAYAYFGLVNVFAKHYNKSTANTDRAVPIVLFTDLEQSFPRATVSQVYDLILSDMAKSEELMNVEKKEKENNFAFSKVALYAFYSRVYLYMGEWEKSLNYTNKALAIQSELQDLSTLGFAIYDAQTNFFYQRSSNEMIMALDRPVRIGEDNLVYASEDFLNLFDPTEDRKTTNYQSPSSKITDLRMIVYVTPDYYADYSAECPDGSFRCKQKYYKYGIRKNGLARCSFRVGELYLTKAEVLARLQRNDEAKEVLLTLLKNRHKAEAVADLENEVAALSSDALLQRILDDRNTELFVEGHRWFDLRRNNQKEIVHKYKDKTYTLRANDERYTIEIPESIVKENPLLAQ